MSKRKGNTSSKKQPGRPTPFDPNIGMLVPTKAMEQLNKIHQEMRQRHAQDMKKLAVHYETVLIRKQQAYQDKLEEIRARKENLQVETAVGEISFDPHSENKAMRIRNKPERAPPAQRGGAANRRPNINQQSRLTKAAQGKRRVAKKK